MAELNIVYTGFKKYRKRRKNLTVVLIGTFSLLGFFIAFFLTVYSNLITFWVKDFSGGDLIVDRKLRFFDLSAPVPVENYFHFRDFLKSNPRLAAGVSPHLRTNILLENRKTSDSASCVVTGIDLAKERSLASNIQISEGRYFKPGTNEIILPEAMANDINSKIGDEIVIYINTSDGYQNYDLLKIAGYLELPAASTIVGQNVAFMPIEKVRELMMTDDDTVSELLYISKKVPAFSGFNGAGHFKKINGLSSFSVVRSLSMAFTFLAITVFLLVLVFSISSIYRNVTLMNIERVKEIGVYLTYGAKPGWIRKIFILELVLYTFYCSLIGGIVAFLAIEGINSLGFYPIDTSTQMLMSSSHFLIKIGPGMFIGAFFILLFMTILGGIRPIWRATSSTRVIELFSGKKS